MREKIRNIVIAAFVIVCIGAYIYEKGEEAKDHSPGAYEQYQQELLAERASERNEHELQHLRDMSVPYEDAWDFLGETYMIEGTIADISRAVDSTGSPTFIDLGEAYPSTNRASIVIWEEHLDDVSIVLDELSIGDSIFVEGYIDSYDGVIQIEVTDPAQIHTMP